MKTKGILLFGIAVMSFTGLMAQPHGKEYRKDMEEYHREIRKNREEYYREQEKREKEAYKDYLKRERKMRKHYAKRMKKGKGYPVYYRNTYYMESPYRRSSGIAIDGEVILRNGSIRIGYYD
ncbi:hypothetical protein ED312_16090 [Sinomicrobium pectinilyticum]|uniref:Uncharacterized protein n=1 Tax=Sinomicrobium pectinilyticum TaxID=1084421 RepID=A0A3N0E531_SINP1|nr:hypothetical protein [Sinomicrobium pectinilyticum]RNL82928.1 hypothetical protein ED312_16090 [Sinomicrobium pectinilyticum]